MFEPLLAVAAEQAPMQVRAARGAGVLVAGRLIARLIDAFVLLVLARLLGPSDFGLVGLAMSVVYIAEAILELPVGQALLRLPEIGKSHLDTAFTLGLIRGLIVLVLTIAVAAPFAKFSDEPRLTLLLGVLSLAPAVRGLASPRMILAAKRLDFRRDFLLDVVGKGVSGTLAITVAFATRSYWSLAVSILTTPLMMMCLSYVLAPYRPRISLYEWHSFAHFVGWNAATQCFSAVNWQIDRLLLGRYASAANLGRFTVSDDLTNVPYQALLLPITRPLATIMYGKSDDREGLRRVYLSASASLTTVGAPIYVGLALLSGPAVRLLLGNDWEQSGNFVALLALAALPGLPAAVWPAIAIAQARSHWVTIIRGVELLIRVPLVWYLVMSYGAEGALWTRLIMSMVLSAMTVTAVRHLIGIPVQLQFRVLARALVAVCLMSCAVWPLAARLASIPTGLGLVLGTVVTAIVGACVYAASILLFWHFAGRPDGIELFALRTAPALRSRVRSLLP